MIISQKKPFDEVCGYLTDAQRIVITGCSECATVCKTGGAEEIEAMKVALEAEGKDVVATKVLTTSCNVLYDKKELKEIREAIANADALLCMACGDGVQTVAKVSKLPTFPANNTMFVGETVRNGIFLERCRTCGDCMLGKTAGICPITACGKSLVNGPCGGSQDGKCEVDPKNKCAWIEIYTRLKDVGKADYISEIHPLRGDKQNIHPRTINLRDLEKEGR